MATADDSPMAPRPIVRAAFAAIVSGLLLAVSLASPARSESILRIVPHADLKNIDPIWTTAYISRNYGYMVYDTLFALDEELNVQPSIHYQAAIRNADGRSAGSESAHGTNAGGTHG